MKTLMRALAVMIFLIPVAGFCQGFMPRWEMSLSADVNSFSDRNGNTQYASLAFRTGFYPILGEGLSIEPELFYGRTYGQNALNVSGNLSYSLGIGYWPVVPFVLVGYGLGNGVPYNAYMPNSLQLPNASNYTDISVINAGVGVKVMTLGGRALVRLEYRYQAFNAKYTSFTDHIYGRRLLLGFSVLL